jgi:hypothetical protein
MKRISSIIRCSAALILGGATLLACGDATDPAGRETDFAAALSEAGNAPSTATSADLVLKEDPAVETDLGGGVYKVCTSRRVSAQRPSGGPAGFPLFDPGAGVIYPGSLLQGATLKKAPPDPIAVKRAGGVVSINIVNGSQGVYRDVSEVTQAKIVQAMNDIIGSNTGVLPANFTLSVHDARTREQLSLGLGVDYTGSFGEIEGKFKIRTDKQYSRFLVKLTQSYYTMSFQLPATYSDLFAPGVTPEDVRRQVGDGNPATYISDVTYGRIYYMLVESTKSQLELNAAMEATFNQAVSTVTINVDMKYLKDQSDLSVSVFALGGEAGAAIRSFGVTDLDSLRQLFAEGSNIKTGVPLSYVVRNVVDNRIVATQLATEYDLVDCRTYADMLRSSAFRFDAAAANLTHSPFTLTGGEQPNYLSSWKESVSGAATMMEDQARMNTWITSCVGTGNVNTTKIKGSFAGRAFTTGGPGGNNYVRYQQHRTPALDATAHPFSTKDSVIHVLPWHRFDGRALEDSNFTIFAVVRSQADAEALKESGGQFFLFTNEPAVYQAVDQRQTMMIGFNWQGNIEMHFRNYGGVQRPAVNRMSWAVYAFRFSKLEGMSVYVDNVAQKSTNASLKLPLAAFRGASIGLLQLRHFVPVGGANLSKDPCWRYPFSAQPQALMDIAFLEAFTVAASDTQIRERMKQLATRFGVN